MSAVLPLVTAPKPPAILAGKPCWLIWKYENWAGDKKPRKIPYYADGERRSGTQGTPADLNRLVDFKTALAAASRHQASGIGIATLPQFGIVAVDFDHCVDAVGAVNFEILEILQRDETYAEFSPSQGGVRAFYIGSAESLKSFSSAGFTFDVEFFGHNGFVTYTGNVLAPCELMGCADRVAPWEGSKALELYQLRAARQQASSASADPLMAYEPRLELSEAEIRRHLAVLHPDLTEPDWVRVGMALHHETQGSDLGRKLWHDWSSGVFHEELAKANSTSPLPVKKYDRKAADSRWERFGHQKGGTVTFRTVLKMTKPLFDAQRKTERRARFAVQPAHEFVKRPPMTWIIKGVVPRAEFGMIFGESGSGKSFLAFDLACAIARGIKWRGKTTAKGRVVFIVAEGAAGFRNRLLAYCAREEIKPEELDVGVIADAPNFLEDDDHALVADAVKAFGKVDVIFVDTLAQVSPGANENAGEDMGAILANCRALREATGALIALIHHAGKDLTRGARGWSGIKGAMDFEIEVNRLDDQRWARVSKMKDGQDGALFGFKLVSVGLGKDADGEDITSCVVDDAAVPTKRDQGSTGAGKWQRLVLDAVDDMLSVAGESLLELNALLKAAVDRVPPPIEGRDRRRDCAVRALEELREAGVLKIESGRVALA